MVGTLRLATWMRTRRRWSTDFRVADGRILGPRVDVIVPEVLAVVGEYNGSKVRVFIQRLADAFKLLGRRRIPFNVVVQQIDVNDGYGVMHFEQDGFANQHIIMEYKALGLRFSLKNWSIDSIQSVVYHKRGFSTLLI